MLLSVLGSTAAGQVCATPMAELRCTIRRMEGTVRPAALTVPLEPSVSSADDAREGLWASVDAIETAGVYRINLAEVDAAVRWQIDVVTAAATLTTPALELSPMIHVRQSEAVFELRFANGVH